MVLITGAAGFIGHHLAAALVARGERVRGLDNFDDAYDPGLKAVPDGVELVRGDVRDPEALDAALDGVSAVAHLAARAGVRESLAAPDRYVSVNVGGTAALVEGMRRHGVRRLLLASSSSVYGVREGRFHEGDLPAPASPYAATKLGAEHVAHAAHVTWGFSVACARLFTVYGPRQRPGMAIARFVRQSLAGEPLTLFGDGASLRDYTYVGDAVRGLIAALDAAAGWEVYNLGGGAPVTLDALADAVAAATGRPLRVTRLPPQAGDVPATHADISRARERLGWTPELSLAAGIAEYVRTL